MSKFNVGDTVYDIANPKKTPMKIIHIYPPKGIPHFLDFYLYACAWFNKETKKESTFPEGALELIEAG
jgi:hypothetical protein